MLPFLSKTLNSVNQKFNGLPSGGLLLLTFRLFALGLSYVFTWVVANYFGASVLGSYALMNATVMVGVLVTRSGLDQFILREVSSVEKSNTDAYGGTYRGILGIQLTFGVSFSLVLFFSADWLSKAWLDAPEMGEILKLASIIIIPLALNFLHAEGFRGRKQLFNYISLVRIWPLVLTLIGVAIALPMGDNSANTFFYVYFASVLSTMLLGITLWRANTGILTVPSFDVSHWSNLLRQSFPMLLAGSMFLIMGWTDTFMLGFFEQPESVGFYHVAIKVSNVVSLVLFGINGIAAPKISYSWANKLKQEFASTIQSSATLSFIFSLPLMLLIIVFRHELLAFFGEGMEVASLALIFLTIGQFVNGSCGSVMNILQMTHNQKYAQYVLMIAALVNVVLNAILIPKYGIEGAAVSTGCSTALWNILSVFVVRWRVQVWSVPFSGRLSSVLKLIRDKRS